MPKDLIKEIEVDLSQSLKNLGDTLYVKDITLPHGLGLITNPDAPIASLQEIREEIIEQPPEEETKEEGKEAEEKSGAAQESGADKEADEKNKEAAGESKKT